MTRSLPNVPLWPRASRTGINRATVSSSSLTTPSGRAVATPPADASSGRRPKPTGRRSATVATIGGRRRLVRLARIGRLERGALLVQLAQPLEPGHELALAVVEPRLDVEREHVPAARGPDAERHRDRELRLVADRHRHAAHAQLLGALRGATVEDDVRLARGQALDLDVPPAHAPDAQAEHLGHGLLGRPAAGE